MKRRMFRKTLRTELRKWRNAGLVDQFQSDALKKWYELDRLGSEQQSMLVHSALLLGVLLLEAAVVVLALSDWGVPAKWYKAGVLLSAMAAPHVIGYYFWRVRFPSEDFIGHGLSIIGTLMFGLNIIFFGRIFQMPVDLATGLAVFAIGAYLVGLAVQSVPQVFLSILAASGWFAFFVVDRQQACLYYPLVAMALLPVCYVWQSSVLFLMTILAVGGALFTNIAVASSFNMLFEFIGLVLISLTIWIYGLIHIRNMPWAAFGAIGRSLGALLFAIIAYGLSFHFIIQLCSSSIYDPDLCLFCGVWPPNEKWIAIGTVLGLLLLAIVVNMARGRHRLSKLVMPLLIAGVVLVMPMIPSVSWATVTMNVVALSLAIYGIVLGGLRYDRRPYWSGWWLLVILVLSRFLELGLGPLFTALGFFACGVILLYAALKFNSQARSLL